MLPDLNVTIFTVSTVGIAIAIKKLFMFPGYNPSWEFINYSAKKASKFCLRILQIVLYFADTRFLLL